MSSAVGLCASETADVSLRVQVVAGVGRLKAILSKWCSVSDLYLEIL